MPQTLVSVKVGGTGANNASDALSNLGAVNKTGDVITGTLNVAATLITQNIVADSNNTYNIGSNEKRYKDLWLSNSTIYLGEATISANGNTLIVPAIETASGLNLESQLSVVYAQANAAYDAANNAQVTVYANSASNVTTQNVNFVNTETVTVTVTAEGSNANIAFSAASQTVVDDTFTASGNTTAAATANIANGLYAISTSAFDQANAARSDANTQNTLISNLNAATGTINTHLGTINSTFVTVNTAISNAHNQANAAYAEANLKLNITGGTINGSLNVSGNLTITGNTKYTNVDTYIVSDPLIYLAANNDTSDIVDIGFMAGHNTSGIYQHSGLVRDAGDGTWYLFTGLADEGHENNVVDFANTTLATLRANINANSILLTGNSVATQANLTLAYNQANTGTTIAQSAYGQANDAYTQANTATTNAGNAYNQANTATTIAQNAYNQANNAYATANNKLDASSYTASDVLTKIKTVDGSGSGLDADTVDGNQASAFALLSGASFTGQVNIGTATNLAFGSQVRQMINLWSTSYGIGVQSSTQYFRSGSRFSWHRGGSHNDAENNAGGGTVAMTLDSGSNLIVTNNVTAYSDIRRKNNILLIENALEKVKSIRGVTYNRTDLEDKEARHAGVIAQEVQKVLPEVVNYDKTADVYSVAYGNMVGLLIEAIKEQQKQIEELKELIKK